MSNANDRFEAIAYLYYLRFRCLAPGKDEGALSGRNSSCPENRDQFAMWRKSDDAFNDAIERIIALEAAVKSLERQLESVN
jgi:hypothetical protein